jgi:hypothetical protein
MVTRMNSYHYLVETLLYGIGGGVIAEADPPITYTEPPFIGRAPQPLHITLSGGGEALQSLDDADRHRAIQAPQIAPGTAGQHDRPTHRPNSRLTSSRG